MISYFCNQCNIRFDPYQNLNQRSLTFYPKSVEVTCVTLPKDHCVKVPWKYIKVCLTGPSMQRHTWVLMGPDSNKMLKPGRKSLYKHAGQLVCGYSDFFFFKTLNQRSLTPSLLGSHVWLYPRIIVPKSHENTWKSEDTVTVFQKIKPKIIDPYMTFDPMSVDVTRVTLPKDHCVQVPWEYINVCEYNDQFCNLKYHILHTYIHITSILLENCNYKQNTENTTYSSKSRRQVWNLITSKKVRNNGNNGGTKEAKDWNMVKSKPKARQMANGRAKTN